MSTRRGMTISKNIILNNSAKRARERPMKTLSETINKDLYILNLTENIALCQAQWRQKIHLDDPK